jgi:tetratricopeptide (TPR) repeat protein
VSSTRCSSSTVIAVQLCSILLAASAPAADLRAEAAAISARIQADRGAGRFDMERQQKAAQELGRLVVGFMDAVDRAVGAGRESAEKAGLRQTFSAIQQPLQSIYDAKAKDMEKLAAAVIEEDGDMDALYAGPEWRQQQVVASQALYYLNWLNLYGARVSDGAEKKALLQKAVAGFSEFAVGDGKSDLFVESVLGRGLAYQELGDDADAERDLRYVVDSKSAAAERRTKARIALVGSYLRKNQAQKAIDASTEFGSATGEGSADLRYLRLRALLLGVKQGGGAADRYRAEAIKLMDSLRRQGGPWPQRMDALLAASVDDPSKWAGAAGSTFAQWQLARMAVGKGDCKQAMPLLEAMLRSEAQDAVARRGDAGYLLAVCQFKSGRQAEAASTLETALPKVSREFQADAAYLRFKAVEYQAAQDGAADDATERLRAAATAFVDAHPEHRSAYEANLRLGEILQGERKFEEAIVRYDAVQGDPVFEMRAGFGALQSSFEVLGETPSRDRERREALLAQVRERLPRVQKAAAEIEKKGGDGGRQASDVLGRSAVLEAGLLAYDAGEDTGAADERIVVVLEGFETRYPERSELFGTALKLRLDALVRLERYAAAEAELRAHGEAITGPDFQEARDQLARRWVRASGRARTKGDEEGALAAQRVAVRLFELSAAGADGDARQKMTLARLYLETGDDAKAKAAFEEILAREPTSLVAMKSLARLAEAGGDPNALQQWERYAAASTPGDPPWYDGQYELARFLLARGDAKRACENLTKVRAVIVGLGDADLRRKLGEVYEQACG